MTPPASGAPGPGRRPGSTALGPDEAATRARFEERATTARRRVRRRRLLAAAGPVLLALLCWVVLASPLTRASEVRLSGVDPADEAAVRTRAEVVLGRPLVRADTAAVAKAVGELPGVAAVSVGRSWPHTLDVKVTSRVPAVALPVSGGWRLLDLDGVEIRTLPSPPAGVPEVVVAGRRPTSEGVAAALQVLASFDDAERSELSDLRVDQADQVSFHLGETQVVWGGPEDSERKHAILRLLREGRPAVIDVSAPGTPVTAAAEGRHAPSKVAVQGTKA